MVAIIDYSAGNIRSVELGFARVGAKSVVTCDPEIIAAADAVVLPGVGAFGDAMSALRERELDKAIHMAVNAGKPFLGICLGMQALFDGSEEGPGAEGLGIIPGMVKRFPECGLKIPHMGWSRLEIVKPSMLLANMPAVPYVYFVHSYACHAKNAEDVLTSTEYGITFNSSVQRNNVVGMQFHPEKSGKHGQIILENFVGGI